ncbi:GNAT family N-acetyltransferase [Streptomyces sp. NPDC057638]|uniref:GNAT family N-acetyltransferase n=1 Tax=Streptomyces sp. NPDC057638 TaxID=3346190 RepID=UPI00369AAEAA
MSNTVTTWYLEQTSPDAAPPVPAPDGVRTERAEVPSPEFSRFLYTAVGGDVLWTDRLAMTYAEWEETLARPGTETWVAYERGTPAGYAELAADGDGSVEIVYFGLIPAFRGRRIGGHLLSYAVARAWELGERHEGVAATKRVWLHTCSDDGPHAMDNYLRRGFSLYDTTTAPTSPTPTPGPWPGSHP